MGDTKKAKKRVLTIFQKYNIGIDILLREARHIRLEIEKTNLRIQNDEHQIGILNGRHRRIMDVYRFLKERQEIAERAIKRKEVT